MHALRAIVALAGALALSAACSVKTAAPVGPAGCDPAQCNPGNTCIADAAGAVACRIGCKAHADCPFNTFCAVSTAANYCVKVTAEVAKKPTGQWGTSCRPSDGLDTNKACDADTGFACYATGTTDALAYCTRFDCAADTDCAGGYYCATINNAPNAKTDVRTFGKTRTVCLQHSYCSPCAGDLDCPIIDGKQSLCAADDGGGRYCSNACAASSNCRLDAACNGSADDGTKLCRPRAGTCKGDGSICSPCGSDADCPMGFCIKGAYTLERFCSVKSTSPCDASSKGTCPAFKGFAGTTIGCQNTSADPNIPKDQCIGLVTFGDSGDIACYTKHP